VHPIEGGFFRRKYRRDRRPGMPIENVFSFYARYGWEMLDKHVRFLWMAWRYYRIYQRVEKDNSSYTDLALTPVEIDDMGDLDLFAANPAAMVTLHKAQQRKSAGNRASVPH
jgi:hypothetical protein